MQAGLFVNFKWVSTAPHTGCLHLIFLAPAAALFVVIYQLVI